MLRIGNTARLIAVAEGSEAELGDLRNRLGRDLLPGEAAPAAARPAPGGEPVFPRRVSSAVAAA